MNHAYLLESDWLHHVVIRYRGTARPEGRAYIYLTVSMGFGIRCTEELRALTDAATFISLFLWDLGFVVLKNRAP